MRKNNPLLALFLFLFLASALPVSQGANVQVKDFVTNKGTSLDSFDSTVGWTTRTGASIALTADKVEGGAALNFTTPRGVSANITKAVSLNLSSARAFSLWVNLLNETAVDNIYIYFSSSPNVNQKYYRLRVSDDEMPPGWTHLVLDKSFFTSYGGESWSNTIIRICVLVTVHDSTSKPTVLFDDYTYDLEGRAKCVITFDDGWDSDYLLAKPVLDSNNQRAVSFVVPFLANRVDYMSTLQLNALYNAGWDVSSHTYNHKALDRLNASRLDYDVNGAYNWLISKGYARSAIFLSYPYGRGFDNQTVVDKVGENNIFARTIQAGNYQALLTPSVPDQWLRLRNFELHNTTLPSSATAQIDHAINERGLLILTFHRLTLTSTPKAEDYLVSNFEVISDYLASRSDMIDVVTLSDLLEYEVPSIIQVYEDQAGFWLTSSGGSGSIGVVDGVETGDVHSGANSTRLQIIAGTSEWVALYHDYPVWQNWGTYDALAFWWRGGDTDAEMEVSVYSPDWSKYTAHFVDDFVGWRKVVLPRSIFTETGSPSWSRVSAIHVGTISTTHVTWLLDSTTMEPADLTLTASVVGGGVVAKSPDYPGYASGQVVTLSATPDAGWVFSGWSGDLGGAVNPVQMTMDGDKSVTATFTRAIVAITFTSSGLGDNATGTVLTIDGVPYTRAQLPKAFNWATGSTHTVTATNPVPATTGKRYSWVSWTNGDGLSGATGTYTVPASSGTVTVNYKTQYTLTVNAGGHGTPGGDGWYDADTNAQATMTPLTVPGSTGVQYVFTGWSGDASGTGSPSSNVLMNGPKTATANWKTQYYLTVTGGSSPTGQGWYDSGSDATASNTWVWNQVTGQSRSALTNWQLDGVNGNPTRSNTGTLITPSITMNAAHAVNFVSATQYYLTVNGGNAVGFGAASPTGDQWYDSGANTTVSSDWIYNTVDSTRTAATNYAIDGVNQNPSRQYSGRLTTSAVTMSTYHTVAFTSIPQYQVSFVVNPSEGGSITPTGLNWEDAGALAILASSSTDFIFDRWESNTTSITFANSNSQSTSSAITGSGIITAYFIGPPLCLDLPFGDDNVPVQDVSGYGNHGTPYGGVTWASSYGGVYSFDGVDDRIIRQTVYGVSASQTSFSFWSKQAGTSTNFMHPIGLFGGHSATIFVGPESYVYYLKSSVSGTVYQEWIGALDSEWHHFAVVFDGDRLKVYVDGVLSADFSAPGVVDKISDSLSIGTTGGDFFSGMIDGVKVYRSVLSASEVQGEYDAGKAEHGVVDTYTLTVSVDGAGYVDLDSLGPYHYGDVVQLTAVPDGDWSFSVWGGDLSGSINPETLTMDGDKSVTATFTSQSPLILDLPFGDDNVPVQDVSGYGNHGTPYGGVTWASSYGGVYSFDGVDDRIIRQTVYGVSASQTSFSFWSKQAGTSTNFMHPIGLFGGHSATIFVGPESYVYYLKSSVSGTVYQEWIGALDSEWHHFAVVFDGDRLKVYVDGVLSADFSAPGVVDKISDSLSIGTTGGDFFSGMIDGVKVYRSVLSASEVQGEYDAGKAEHGVVDTYTLTVSVDGAGYVDLDSLGPYHYGDVVQLTAVPDGDWSFSVWGGDLSGSINPETLTMDGDKSVTATFTSQSPLILDLPFGDDNVPVQDVSGYGNHGTPYGGVTWASSYGGVYSFDGVDDRIIRQTVYGVSASQTSFSFWSKQAGTSTNFMHPIGLFGGHSATIFVGPESYVYYLKSSVSGTVYQEWIGALDSEWHHFAVVFDGDRLKVYVDGVLSADFSAPGVVDKISDSLSIGTTGGDFFSGMIDGVKVYRSVLSASEVQGEYDAGKAEHGVVD